VPGSHPRCAAHVGERWNSAAGSCTAVARTRCSSCCSGTAAAAPVRRGCQDLPAEQWRRWALTQESAVIVRGAVRQTRRWRRRTRLSHLEVVSLAPGTRSAPRSTASNSDGPSPPWLRARASSDTAHPREIITRVSGVHGRQGSSSSRPIFTPSACEAHDASRPVLRRKAYL